MKNKKKIIVIVIIVILILLAAIAGIVYAVRNRSGAVVEVYSMELLNSSGFAGGESSLSGTITSDYVQEVYADEDQNVADVYVQQGDYVEKGDNLLKYDVEEQELDLQLQELEIQSSTMELEDLEAELEEMKNTRASSTIDSSGSNVVNTSLNFSSLKGEILAGLMSASSVANTSSGEEEETEESGLLEAVNNLEEDKTSGDGSEASPYVYRLITDGRIRGSVINDLLNNNKCAVFYEYNSEEDGRNGNVANSVEIRSNTIFKESIASFGWYTVSDLNDAMVTVDQIKIQPNRTSVKAGKSYNFTAKLTGKNSDALTVTWTLKRNKSDSTTLIDGTLTVGEDETAKTLKIIASAGSKRAVLTVKVKNNSSSDSKSGSSGNSGSSDDSSGSDDSDYDSSYDSDYDSSYDSSYDSGSDSDTDYSGYTAEELADAIADLEAQIAEARQNLNQAKLDYEEAKKEVDAATVKATVSGEVTIAYTKEAMPDDGSPAIIVRGQDGMYVNVDVSEMSLDTVKIGGTIYCTSMETYEQYEAEIIDISQYPASNSSYDGTSNPNSSYYPVVAYIAQADDLVTGETVEVSYSSQSMGTISDEAIYLQKAYIRTDDDDRSYVYKEGEDGRLEKQYVKTGVTLYGQYVEVVSGLTMDDNIAFPYGKDVKEGAKVELSENTDNIIY